MTPLLAAALELQTLMEQRSWRFCLIGGIAVLRWGEPRFTRDVDVTLLAGFGNEREYIAPVLAAGFRGRIPDAEEFAQRSRVLLVETPGGVPADIALGGLEFEARMVERSSRHEFEPACELRTCSAEDLIVQKLFAFRQQDLLDAESVVVRQSGRLDWKLVERELGPLAELKEEPGIMEHFDRLRSR